MKPHPAKFSAPLLPVIAEHLAGYQRVFDPMAGVGTLARYLYAHGWPPDAVFSNELEPEWAEQCPFPRFDYDARSFPWADGVFDAIATSPAYGNRMADTYDGRDGSSRSTYRIALGRLPSEGSTAVMQWGDDYRRAHEQIIEECVRVLRPGGRVVWNVKDHFRRGHLVEVSVWHRFALERAGLLRVAEIPVSCPGQRRGANRERRVDHEWVLVFDKPLDG